MTGLATVLLLTVGTPTTSAAQVWSQVEQTWRSAPRLHVEARVRAEGRPAAELDVSLDLDRGDRARLDARGTILGDRARVWLVSDGETARWGASLPEPAPKFLQEGLTVAWLRLGLLYHVLEIGSGLPPEGTRRDPAHWVTLTDLAFAPDAPGAGCRWIRYRIEVSGAPVGRGRVCVDDARRPRERWSKVRFEGRTLTVEERYRRVEAPKSLDPKLFETYPGGP